MKEKPYQITWQEVTGNRFNRNLHPAMLSEDGYHLHLALKRLGDTEKSLFDVVYGEDYVLGWITYRLCTPLNHLSKKEVLDLVSKAYDNSTKYFN